MIIGFPFMSYNMKCLLHLLLLYCRTIGNVYQPELPPRGIKHSLFMAVLFYQLCPPLLPIRVRAMITRADLFSQCMNPSLVAQVCGKTNN